MIWFKSKPRNRRHGREHVLDVKLRSRQVRASRLRLGAVALSLACGTILGFYLIWHAGAWALNCLVYENKAFAIQQVDVQTDGVITPAQLRRWAGVKMGENLLALDLARVKRDVEMVPLVRSVAVERVLPGTVRIRVSEREPLAQVYVAQLRPEGGSQPAVLHLDSDGYVLSILDPRQRRDGVAPTNDSLPLVTGGDPGGYIPGRQVDSPQVRAALKLIDVFSSSPMAAVLDLRTVDVSAPDILIARASDGSEVTFATQDLERQLRRWREIYDQGLKMNRALAVLDLSVTNYIPVRWLDAGIVPPNHPAPKNQPRNRRRNV